MTITVSPVNPQKALPIMARLYSSSEADFQAVSAECLGTWLALNERGEALGALALRPSPAHGAEVMGGAFAGPEQEYVALALVQAAQEAQPQLYAYAEAAFFPARALQAADWHPVGAYTRMTGAIPRQQVIVPEGFQLVSLADVHDPLDRVAAHECYSDLIGHTFVPPEVAAPNFAGSRDDLGCVAYDQHGRPVGICRAWLQDDQLSLGSPGVHPTVRSTGLRQALLLWACQAGRSAGAKTLIVEAWGESNANRTADEELGLQVTDFVPIYAPASCVTPPTILNPQ